MTNPQHNHRGLQVMIIGYEKLRKYIKKLRSCQPPIGLIVCDEGHRLKSKDNKTTKMFNELSCTRRIRRFRLPWCLWKLLRLCAAV
jgi:DNA repair and recombination protein RAD54B